MMLGACGLCILVSLWSLFSNAVGVTWLNFPEKSTIFPNHSKNIKEIVNVTCILDKYGLGYTGTHNITHDGLPCIEWRRSGALRGKNISKNYCRNPDGDIRGPWCYAYMQNNSPIIRHCDIPLCQPKDKIQVGVRMQLKRECPFGFKEEIIKGQGYEKYSYCVVKQEFLSKLPTGKYSLKLTNPDNNTFCPEGFKIENPNSLMEKVYCTRTDSTSDLIEFPKYLTPEPDELIFVAVKFGSNSTCPEMSGQTFVIIRKTPKVTTCYYFARKPKNNVDRKLAILVPQKHCPKNWPVYRRFSGWQFVHVFGILPKNACMPDKDVLNYPDGDYCLLSLDVNKGDNRQCPEEFIDVDIYNFGTLDTKFCCAQSRQFGNSNEKIFEFFNVTSLLIMSSAGNCEITKKDVNVKVYSMEVNSFVKHECTNCDLFEGFHKYAYNYFLPPRFIKDRLKVCGYEKETSGFAYATLNGRCPPGTSYASIKYSRYGSIDDTVFILSFCTILNYPRNISLPEGRYCLYKVGKNCPLGFQPVKSKLPPKYYKLISSGGNNDMTYCCKFGPKNISFENATLPYVTKYFEFGLPYPNSSFKCVHGLATHTAIEDSQMCHYYPTTDKSPRVSIVFPYETCRYRADRYNGSHRPIYLYDNDKNYCKFYVNDRPPPGAYCAAFSKNCPPKYFDYITYHPLMEHVICCRRPVQNDTREKEYTASGWNNDLKYFSLFPYMTYCPVFERYNYGKEAVKDYYSYTVTEISEDHRTNLTNIGFRVIPVPKGYTVAIPTCDYELDLYDRFVTWPRGQYAFPKPSRGCPSSFKSGEFTHSMNIANPSFEHSKSIQLDRDYKIGGSTIKWGFCVKNDTTHKYHISLQYGRYCLMKVDDSCPMHFSEGSVKFVEVTTLNNSRIRREGVLPKIETNGPFITYHFCCRSGRGDIAHEPMYLPSQSGPFYLMKYGTYCQSVFGMRFTEEFICIDSEDSSQYLNYTFQVPFEVKGATPVSGSFIKGCDFQINLCYYELDTPVAAPLTAKSGPLVDWPIGSYVFFKPLKRTCPFGFDEGAISIQSFYELSPKFIRSVMLGYSEENNDIYSYCKRNSSMVDKLRPAEDWPPGNYCLIFERECPSSMLHSINQGFHDFTPVKQMGAQMAGWSTLCCRKDKLPNPPTLPYFPGDYYSFIIKPTRDGHACPPHKNARVALVDMRTEILCIYERLDESVEFPDGDYLLPAPQAPVNACASGFKLVEHRHFPFGKSYLDPTSITILKFCQKEKNAPNNAKFPRGNYCVLTTSEICPTSQFTMKNILILPYFHFGDELQKLSRYFACCQNDERIISNIAIPKVPFALYSSSSCSYVDGFGTVWETKGETVLVQSRGLERLSFNQMNITLQVCKYDQINGWEAEFRHNCHPNASYDLFLKDNICQCLPGYFGDGKRLCKKITNETDQCANLCDKRVSICSRPTLPEGYSCVCKEGYEFKESSCILSCRNLNCKPFSYCYNDGTESKCICDYYAVDMGNGQCQIDLLRSVHRLSGFDYLRQLNFSCFGKEVHNYLQSGKKYPILFIFFPINKKSFSTCDRDHYYYGFTTWNTFKNGTSFQTAIHTESGMSILISKDKYNVWMIGDKFKVSKVDLFSNAVVLYLNISESFDIAFRDLYRGRTITWFLLGGILLFVLSIILLFIINYRRETSIFGKLFETRSEANIHFTAADDAVEVES